MALKVSYRVDTHTEPGMSDVYTATRKPVGPYREWYTLGRPGLASYYNTREDALRRIQTEARADIEAAKRLGFDPKISYEMDLLVVLLAWPE